MPNLTRLPGRIGAAAATTALLLSAATATAVPVPSPTVAATIAGHCTLTSGVHTNRWDGQLRRWRLLVPAAATSATPVYVSLHGAGGTAEAMAEVTGMDTLAEDAVVVYPQASAATGNVWQVDPGSPDIDFVAWIVSNLHANGCGSPTSTSISGWSMGAMMTSRLLCTHPDLASSATMVDGALPPTVGCTIPSNVAIAIIHGTADPILAWDGSIPAQWVRDIVGTERQHINYPGLTRATMGRMWAAAKGCPAPAATWTGETGVVWLNLTGCADAPTRVAAVIGGGHDWDPYGSAANPGWTRAHIVQTAQSSGAFGAGSGAEDAPHIHAGAFHDWWADTGLRLALSARPPA